MKFTVSSVQFVPAQGGQVWSVYFATGDKPTGTRLVSWNENGYRTALVALSIVKRHAQHNGGTTLWVILGENTWNPAAKAYTGPVTYSLYVGGESDRAALEAQAVSL